jgi:hypothetical protein
VHDGRDAAYRVLCTLLRDENIAVRVAACDALLKLVDDVSFFAAGFDNYVVNAIEGFFALFAAAREVDTKLRVLNVVAIVMEGVGERVQAAVPGIVQVVPSLWAEAQEQHLLKGAVLVTVTRLVQALGQQVCCILNLQ